MKWFLYAISLYFIAVGSCAVLYTHTTRGVMEKMIKGTDRRALAVLPLIAGIAFLLAACASRYPWFIRLIGLMGIGKGVLIFAAPKELYDRVTTWYLQSLSDQAHRLWGIIGIILGTAMLSWII